MKTIEISDEMYDSLMELSKELNTQSHRSTAMPYFFQIQTQDKRHVADGCGTECYYFDGSEIETDEEINEAVADYKDWSISRVSKLSKDEKIDILEDAGWQRAEYQFADVYENAFFTEKACKEHIRLNHYHYNKPVDYLTHAFRNPEMELVLKFLCELTNGQLHK
jgi:hypothetical protein